MDWAAQLALLQSARSAHDIGQLLQPMLEVGPQSLQTHARQSCIQSLFGGVMRLAVCAQIRPQDVAELSEVLGRVAQAGSNQAAAARLAGHVQATLAQITQSAGITDHGTMFALGHCRALARQMRDDAELVLPNVQSSGISMAARQTLAVASQLADPAQRAEAPNPAIARLLQGVAGMLHGVTAQITNAGTQVNLITPVRQLAATIADATQGGIAPALQTQRCGQVVEQVTSISRLLARYPTLMSGASLGLFSIEADAAAVAVAVQPVRHDRLMNAEGDNL